MNIDEALNRVKLINKENKLKSYSDIELIKELEKRGYIVKSSASKNIRDDKWIGKSNIKQYFTNAISGESNKRGVKGK